MSKHRLVVPLLHFLAFLSVQRQKCLSTPLPACHAILTTPTSHTEDYLCPCSACLLFNKLLNLLAVSSLLLRSVCQFLAGVQSSCEGRLLSQCLICCYAHYFQPPNSSSYKDTVLILCGPLRSLYIQAVHYKVITVKKPQYAHV